MNAEQARDLLARQLEELKYEQGGLAAARGHAEATDIGGITPGDQGVAVTFKDGTRVLYAVITEEGQQ